MHVNCAEFVYKAMGELIQVLYLFPPEIVTNENSWLIKTVISYQK